MTPQRAPAAPLGKTELVDWIGGWISSELKIARDQIKDDLTFVRYGMDSVHAMMMVGDLEERLGRRLPPTLAWDFPTVDTMANHLAAEAPTAKKVVPSNDKDADILARLDELSEDEIDRLLHERLDSTTG